MSSRNLVICDPETDYAVRLAAFLSEKKELAFQVNICSSLQQLQAMERETIPDLLLVSESYTKEQREGMKARRMMLLTTKCSDGKDSDSPAVFKYQSGEDIFSQMVQGLSAEEDVGDFLNIRKKGEGKIIGFYSPVHRSGQTTTAVQRGKELARNHNVLYLNLETYAGLNGHFAEEKIKNMSALLYYAKQETKNLNLILPTLVRKMGELYYIPPAVFPEDIQAVTKEEWRKLFSEIIKTSIYDVLILDLGEGVNGLFDILKSCDEVCMTAADDRYAAAKIKQYEETLDMLGYREVWERMIHCDTGRTIKGEDFRET